MSENYYYSSLSGQEIEDTLVGAVRFNAMQGLTTSQKAQARQNIGAGEEDVRIKIKGFYDTLADLQQHIPVGTEGDVYAVGTASPYDLYVWDTVHSVWVNYGPISFSDAIIDDNDISTSSAWSSAKTTNEIDTAVDSAVSGIIDDDSEAADKTWSAFKINGIKSQIINFFSTGSTSYETIAALAAFVSSKGTGDVILVRASTDLTSQLIGKTVGVASIALVMKASSNNAYYLAFSRDVAAIGNISLTTSAVTVVHEFAQNDYVIRSVSWTYSCGATDTVNTNLKTIIDADMPSGYKFVAIAGYASGAVTCLPYSIRYADSSYSLAIRNVSSSPVSNITAQIRYLCVPI